MSKDMDENTVGSKPWSYDGDRAKFREAMERIESDLMEIGGANLVKHWLGERSAAAIDRFIAQWAPYKTAPDPKDPLESKHNWTAIGRIRL